MNEHPIQGLMKTTMDNIKEMIDVNTIVGDAVETPDGSVIIPISKVSFGFASGGAEYEAGSKNQREEEESSKFPFGGGSGAGVSVQPVAFLVVGGSQVKLLPVTYSSVVDRIVDLVPNVIDNIDKAAHNLKNNKNPNMNQNANQSINQNENQQNQNAGPMPDNNGAVH